MSGQRQSLGQRTIISRTVFASLSLHMIAITSILGPLTSCGRNNRGRLQSGDETKPLLVVMGGFSTCALAEQHDDWESPLGMRLARHTFQMIAGLQTERSIEFDVIFSCFTKLSELRYTESTDNYAKLHVSQPTGEVVKHVALEITRHPKTFIIGHSYGGWLAMRAVIGGPNKGHIKSLFTVDPISQKYCRLESPVGWGNCTVAPPDIGEPQQRSIDQSTDLWMNYWEDQTFYLHSGAMPHATKNIQLSETHSTIDDAPEIC